VTKLAVERITTRIGDRVVVEDVSFGANAGELVAIVGPNGAGKTTLLESIVGLRPAIGRVGWGGVVPVDFRARADVFAYMPDEATLPEEASVETILRGVHRDPARRLAQARRFGIEPFLSRGARELSRGEAKRVWIAATLLLERPVLVMDEPFGAFDPLQLDELLPTVKTAIGERGTALVTIHQMSIAERIADRIVMLARGRVVAEGTLAELRVKAGDANASLEDVFRSLLRKKASDVAA
jgi:ABC-2 type transport system ATP-binding protein